MLPARRLIRMGCVRQCCIAAPSNLLWMSSSARESTSSVFAPTVNSFESSSSRSESSAGIASKTGHASPEVFKISLPSPFLKRDKAEYERIRKSSIMTKLFSSMFASSARRLVDSALMYEACANHAINDVFYEVLDLPFVYATQMELAILHVWMCKIRLKTEGEEGRKFLEAVLERMWDHVGRSLQAAGASSLRFDKFLRQIQERAFGSFVTYDHALTRTKNEGFKDLNAVDHPLLLALSSLVYGEEKPHQWRELRCLTDYVLRELKNLDSVSGEDILRGDVEFSCPLH